MRALGINIYWKVKVKDVSKRGVRGEYRRRMVQEANTVATPTLKVRIHKGLLDFQKNKKIA